MTEFETWDSEKFEKHGIDLDAHDHQDVKSRPPILMHLCQKQREPYITFIHACDQRSQGLLSSKHEKLIIGNDEAGVGSPEKSDDTPSSVTVSSSSSTINKKRKSMDKAAYELSDVMNTFMRFCGVEKNTKGVVSKTKKQTTAYAERNEDGNNNSGEERLECLSLKDLHALNDQLKQHFLFLKDLGRLDEEKEQSTLSKMDKIFDVINMKTQGDSDRAVDDSDNNH